MSLSCCISAPWSFDSGLHSHLAQHMKGNYVLFGLYPIEFNYLVPMMNNKACLSVLFPLLTLILKQEDRFSDLLQRYTFSLLYLTCFLLWQSHPPSVSITIREFGHFCSFDQSFVSIKYDMGWAVLFRLITLTQTQHGENPAMQGAEGSRSNTPLVCLGQEMVCLKSFVLFCAFFSVGRCDWTGGWSLFKK